VYDEGSPGFDDIPPEVPATPARHRQGWQDNDMQVDRAEVVAILRSRGLHDRADWVERQLPQVIDTNKNGSLLRMLHIDSTDLLEVISN